MNDGMADLDGPCSLNVTMKSPMIRLSYSRHWSEDFDLFWYTTPVIPRIVLVKRHWVLYKLNLFQSKVILGLVLPTLNCGVLLPYETV